MNASGRSGVVLEHGALYRPPRSPVIVHVPPITYLMVDGSSPARTSLAWAAAVDALRGAELAVRAGQPDVEPAPLEVLWHAGEGWTLMLAVAADAPPESAADLPEPVPVRYERLHERWAAQLLHVGTPEERERALRRLTRFIDAQGYRAVGPLHEILLDPPAIDPDDAPRRAILRRTLREL